MGIVSAIALFALIWFLTFLVVLPIRVRTQGDLGEVVQGTHSGAPAQHHLRRKVWITTAVSVVLWAAITWVIATGRLTVRDLDMFGRMDPPAGDAQGRGTAGASQ